MSETETGDCHRCHLQVDILVNGFCKRCDVIVYGKKPNYYATLSEVESD